MTSTHSATAPAAPPWRLFSTTAHLAFLGTFGIAAFGLLVGFAAMSVGFIALAGIGLVMLVGVVYVLYGIGWWETARVAGLYRLEVPLPHFAAPPEPGFKGWLYSLGNQLLSGRMWRALSSAFIASVLGTVQIVSLSLALWGLALLLLRFTGWGAGWIISPFTGSTELVGALLVTLVGLALAIALALLHRVLTTAIIGGGAREEQLEAHARASSAQRAGAVRAADVERTRIERDLHDGVQPRLVSVGMTLGLAQETIDSDPEAAKELVAEAHASTKAAITELRQLARGIHTSVLDDRGLDAALSALASRSHIPVTLDVDLPGRVNRDAEAALYFVIAESLTNAAKHSRASSCRISVRLLQGPHPVLWARIDDDGIGGARVVPGGGLDGISNRVFAAGGTLTITSPEGGPTTVEVHIPCAS